MLTKLILYAWPVLTVALFFTVRPRRAVIISMLGGMLFLPETFVGLPALPDLNKYVCSSFGCLAGALIADSKTLFRFRFRWYDFPMLGFCTLAPFTASMTNGLGVWDGLSEAIRGMSMFGGPYLLGRVYFRDLPALKELALGVFIGGLLYAPLVIFESVMSPQLHNMVYGFHPHKFAQTRRLGGWRPTVFMEHGLMVGLWMTCSTIAGFWLWRSGAVKRIRHIPVPMGVLVGGMIVMVGLCRSMNAYVLLACGIGLYFLMSATRLRVALLILILIPPGYAYARTAGLYSGDSAVALARMVNPGRADSLAYRIYNEQFLIDRAMEQPLFGWGGHDRMRPPEEEGGGAADGAWVIALGQRGFFGLTLWLLAMLLPAMFALKWPGAAWTSPQFAGAAGLAVVLTLYSVDSLVNDMPNVIYILAAGALTAACAEARPRIKRQPRTRTTRSKTGARSAAAGA